MLQYCTVYVKLNQNCSNAETTILFKVVETRMEPAVEMNEIEDNLVTLSRSKKEIGQKKRRVKRRRPKHVGREMRGVGSFQSEKQGRKKPPRPAGLPPHMIKKLK